MMANNNNGEPSYAPQAETWYELKVGSSFKGNSSSKFSTLRYEFKPASIDKTQPGSLHKNKENRVTVDFNNNQPGKPKVSFEGSSEDYKENDVHAVLFFDGESFRLERLSRAVKRLRHVRLPGESASAANMSSAANLESKSPQIGKFSWTPSLSKQIAPSVPVEVERIDIGEPERIDMIESERIDICKPEQIDIDGTGSPGGSLYKGINRCIATFTAGALAIGIHWIASKSGDTMEPIIRSTSVFILASAATFSRFIPTIKKWFDYGITIFILTFCLVAVSDYRVDKLIDLAVQRISTITIGIFICLLVAILVFPVWVGSDLHLLITRNMDKLADSLEGCMDAYFHNDQEVDLKGVKTHKSEGYKCVLNSKALEDSLANLARWEPAHGRFSFRHPWTNYQKIGAAMRYCAYYIETLNSCIDSDIQSPEYLKKHIGDICIRLSLDCSDVLREASSPIKSMRKSGNIDVLIEEMNNSVQGLDESLAQHYPCIGGV